MSKKELSAEALLKIIEDSAVVDARFDADSQTYKEAEKASGQAKALILRKLELAEALRTKTYGTLRERIEAILKFIDFEDCTGACPHK